MRIALVLFLMPLACVDGNSKGPGVHELRGIAQALSTTGAMRGHISTGGAHVRCVPVDERSACPRRA